MSAAWSTCPISVSISSLRSCTRVSLLFLLLFDLNREVKMTCPCPLGLYLPHFCSIYCVYNSANYGKHTVLFGIWSRHFLEFFVPAVLPIRTSSWPFWEVFNITRQKAEFNQTCGNIHWNVLHESHWKTVFKWY